jgi:hypothetical protein
MPIDNKKQKKSKREWIKREECEDSGTGMSGKDHMRREVQPTPNCAQSFPNAFFVTSHHSLILMFIRTNQQHRHYTAQP